MTISEPATLPIVLPPVRSSRVWRASVALAVTVVLLAALGVAALGWYRLTHGAAVPSAAAGPASTLVAPRAEAPATSPTTGEARRPATSAPRALTSPVAAYAGEWQAHGIQATFDDTGHGKIDFRTYTSCSMPEPGVACEPDGAASDAGHGTVVLEPAARGGLQWRVLTSNDSEGWPVGQVQPVRALRTGVLEIGTGDRAWGLCKPPASDELCGARRSPDGCGYRRPASEAPRYSRRTVG